MPKKREIYRLDLPGSHLTNWIVDEAAKTMLPPMMPMNQKGLAIVEPDTILEGMDEMYGGPFKHNFSSQEIEKAKEKIREELDKLPDDVEKVEYITMR